MKIDVDLSELVNEDGSGVKDLLKDSIIETVANMIYRSMEKEAKSKLSTMIENGVKAKVTEALDKMLPEIMNYEFTETSSYGVKREAITVKNKILDDVAKSLQWRDGNWDSDKSTYTKVIKSIVEKKMNEFSGEFKKNLDAIFVKEALEYAQKTLAAKLGIKA
jgi:cobalamin biosynthesis protein CbiD